MQFDFWHLLLAIDRAIKRVMTDKKIGLHGDLSFDHRTPD
jgi:hypothetical protein